MSHVARENYLHAFGYRGGRVWRNERNVDFLSLSFRVEFNRVYCFLADGSKIGRK